MRLKIKTVSNMSGISPTELNRLFNIVPELKVYLHLGDNVRGNKYRYIEDTDYQDVMDIIVDFKENRRGNKRLTMWNRTSVECYENNMMCSSRCSSYIYCRKFRFPPIKQTVLDLYTRYGKPDLTMF